MFLPEYHEIMLGLHLDLSFQTSLEQTLINYSQVVFCSKEDCQYLYAYRKNDILVFVPPINYLCIFLKILCNLFLFHLIMEDGALE